MELLIKLIFGFLCGMLYLVGCIFGYTYEEISVYICIYGWPALCVAMPTVIALVALYNWVKKLTLWNTINLALSTSVAYAFGRIADLLIALYSHGNETHAHLETIHDKFVACRGDLMVMASGLGMTYEEVNLWIYCYMFLAIALVMWLWFEITIPRKWMLNRLWRKYLPLFSTEKS